MKLLAFAAVLAAGCGSGSPDSVVKTPRPLVFERWSPAQQSSYDVFVAASGSVVVMTSRISRDGGASWTALDPRLGQLGRVEIDGTTVITYATQVGLARWDMATGQIAPVAGAPGFAGDRTWRRDRATGRFVVFDPVEDSVAVERASGWTTAALPRPSPGECCPYITDLESNGQTLVTVSGWGVHRSVDGGATWQRSAQDLPGAGRDLLVLGDGRFALVGGATTYLFSATGEAAGTLATLVLGDDEAAVCEDGSIITSGSTSGIPSAAASGMPSATTSGIPSATTSGIPSATTSGIPSATTSGIPSTAPSGAVGLPRAAPGASAPLPAGRVTRDLGATWQPLASAGALDLIVERASCDAGSYWVLLRSTAWGYRLVRYAALGAPGVAIGNWDAAGPQAWASSGPAIVRTGDGAFLAGGLAWRGGDPAWTLREMPAHTWSSGGVLFGAAGGQFYTSGDAGVTWTALAAAGLGATDPDSFARTADGAMYVGQFTGQSVGAPGATTDTWRADVWRSTDLGATWSIAYTATATRAPGQATVGEAHRFVGITVEGTWIATDAVSIDGGASWRPTEAIGDRSIAHLMEDGSLVMQPADASGEIWRVYAAGGQGELLATHAIQADGQPVLAADLRSVAFDSDGHAYVARGTPHVQIWRSTTPLQHPAAAD